MRTSCRMPRATRAWRGGRGGPGAPAAPSSSCRRHPPRANECSNGVKDGLPTAASRGGPGVALWSRGDSSLLCCPGRCTASAASGFPPEAPKRSVRARRGTPSGLGLIPQPLRRLRGQGVDAALQLPLARGLQSRGCHQRHTGISQGAYGYVRTAAHGSYETRAHAGKRTSVAALRAAPACRARRAAMALRRLGPSTV